MAEWIGEFVGFLVVLWVLWRFVVPPVRKIMKGQRETVGKQVEDAQKATERLAAAEKQYSEALAEARTEAAKIRDAARADGQRIVEEMRAAAEREIERIRQRGQEDLATQRQQVIRELRTRIGQLSADAAADLVNAHLSRDTKRKATVDRFLDELEAMSAPDDTVGAAATATRGDA
ncbi:F0F1 ATP synthase subunit B [Actinophytocola sp.]|uniref:F0F1 ATP synthase subunit B n=1 Tax=Actinophytocola sp. TaxID=1872138 RepID=UPI003D6AFF2F